MESGTVLWKTTEMRANSNFLFLLLVSDWLWTQIAPCWKNIWIFLRFFSVSDFSSASKYVYTSTNLPLSIPFWITPKEFVQKILSNVETIEWLFTPKTSSNQQTLFSFSSKDGQLKQEDTASELSYKNFTDGGNFSLHRNLARVEDRGTYNCSITFTNGYVLSRSLVVEVLESKWKQNFGWFMLHVCNT